MVRARVDARVVLGRLIYCNRLYIYYILVKNYFIYLKLYLFELEGAYGGRGRGNVCGAMGYGWMGP